MKLSRSTAALLSAEERRPVEASGPWQVKDLVRAIERTRRLRDQAQARVQRANGAASNDSGEARARLFERALAELREQLARLASDSAEAMREVGRDAGARRTSGSAGRKSAARKSTARKTATKKSAAKKSAAKKTATKKSTAKKAAAKKASAKKASAKKTTARKTTARKTTAKKSTARKTTAKKPTAKKSTAKKSTAKKATARRTTAKKSTAKQVTARKTTTKQAAARPSTARKPAARKSASARQAPSTPPTDRARAAGAARAPAKPLVRRVFAGTEPETHGPASGPPQVEISRKARIPIPRELGAPFGSQVTGQDFRRIRALKGPHG